MADYQTCAECGAVVWVKGEGLRIHDRWHLRTETAATMFQALVNSLTEEEMKRADA